MTKKLTPQKMLENLFKSALKELSHDYKIDLECNGWTKGEDVFDFLQGLDFSDYENLAWFAGYLRGLEEAKNTLKIKK